MAATTKGLRAYLRLPPEGFEDPLGPGYAGISHTPGDEFLNRELEMYLSAAISYCSNAGVPWRDGDPLYDLLIYKLAAQEYDNRAMGNMAGEPDKAEEARQRMLNSFMLSLRYALAPDTGATDA